MMRIWLLLAGYVLTAIALGSAALAAYLIHSGVYPLEPTGSLAHVGIIVAGIILGCFSLTAALAGFLVFCKADRSRVAESAPPPNT